MRINLAHCVQRLEKLTFQNLTVAPMQIFKTLQDLKQFEDIYNLNKLKCYFLQFLNRDDQTTQCLKQTLFNRHNQPIVYLCIVLSLLFSYITIINHFDEICSLDFVHTATIFISGSLMTLLYSNYAYLPTDKLEFIQENQSI